MPFLAKAVLLIAAGWLAGVMNSIAGGGTLVTFPSLVFSGIPAISANATSTVALLTGVGSSIWAYRKELATQSRWAWRFAGPSMAGGLIGAVLLLNTGETSFRAIIPYLILFATALFTFQGPILRFLDIEAQVVGKSRHGLAAALAFQLFVAIYGGYFGAGIGILMLATLGMLGHQNIYEMNSVKVTQAFLINIVAAAYFIFAGKVLWVEAGLVGLGSVVGGVAGPWIGRRVGQKVVRRFVSVVGFAIGLYFLLA
jgi:uncharacterized protein